MKDSAVKKIRRLGFTWETNDPFLFCVHHKDLYPAGNGSLGPASSLDGRNIGRDFELKDGWRMYHGRYVPGFPEHPHRGFETVTIVLEGFIDHFDSAGASGRYGNGDIQWMTAGSGLQHAEMFPLLNKDKPNPLELFQIWLNLPASSKMSTPDYKMLWSDTIPVYKSADSEGRSVSIRIIAGELQGNHAPAPSPDSWAADQDNEVGIWLMTLEPYAEFNLPAADSNINRSLYLYEGASIKIENADIPGYHAADISSEQTIVIKNGPDQSRILLLQGKPIAEPLVQYGPFVMNTQEEIQQAFEDFKATEFGGWPWNSSEPVHPSSEGRFARYSDGKEELK